MKIIINMKLGDNKVDSKLRPIAQLESVDRILVVRDYPGPCLPKVEYYFPPSFISRFAILAAVYKLLILIYLSLFRKPELIHSYLLFPHGILAFIAAKLTGRPVGISLIAGPIELYAIGSPLRKKCSEPLPWFGKVFLKILKYCNSVTTTGSHTRDFLMAHGIDKNRIHILRHSVSELGYYPMNIPKKYDVISVGRLAPVKHIEVLLRAVSRVKEKYPDVKVGIVGDGPCAAHLEQLSVELGISDSVEFLGYKEDIVYYYNSSRIFVLTSEREGFPSTFVEAMLCGLPSIVSNCGDIIDIAKDGFNSLVIQNYSDVDGFAQAIIRLMGDKELYHKLSQNALETARGMSVDRVAQQWELILHKIKTHD